MFVLLPKACNIHVSSLKKHKKWQWQSLCLHTLWSTCTVNAHTSTLTSSLTHTCTHTENTARPCQDAVNSEDRFTKRHLHLPSCLTLSKEKETKRLQTAMNHKHTLSYWRRIANNKLLAGNTFTAASCTWIVFWCDFTTCREIRFLQSILY